MNPITPKVRRKLSNLKSYKWRTIDLPEVLWDEKPKLMNGKLYYHAEVWAMGPHRLYLDKEKVDSGKIKVKIQWGNGYRLYKPKKGRQKCTK